MNFTAILDISTFVWSQEDFKDNKHCYYELISLAPIVYEKVKDNEVRILLRNELYNLLMSDFPYFSISEISSDYYTLTVSFFTSIKNWIPYIDVDAPTISTSPNIVKDHFSNDLKKESKEI